MKPTIIHRQTYEEAEEAVNELLKRGFELIYPITEIQHDGKKFSTDSYKRRIFEYNTFHRQYVAKLRKVIE